MISATKPIRIRAIIISVIIHIGDKTHHQDQVATAVMFNSFKVMNTIVSKPTKPIPLELELLLEYFDIY